MPKRIWHAARGLNGQTLMVLCIATALVVVLAVAWRAYLTAKADVGLCERLAEYVANQPHPSSLEPGQYGYSYAHAHPEEWPERVPHEVAVERAKQAFGCGNLPSKVG